MSTPRIGAGRQLVYWTVVAAALASAGCWVATRDAVLERLPAGVAGWMRTELVLWRGASFSDWLAREAAVWSEIWAGPDPVKGVE